jgi:hypothetical protein
MSTAALILSPAAGALFLAAFEVPRDPRSEPYKNGVRAALAYRIDRQRIPRLYKLGTAEDDAYYSGMQEGYAIWRSAGEPTGGAS